MLNLELLAKPKPTTLADYSLWDYQFIYSHEHAEQDFVIINAEFNLTKPIGMNALALPQDPFAVLAQYMSVADELWNNIGGLFDPKTKIPMPTIENSVVTLSELITNIAGCWGTDIPSSSNSDGGSDPYEAAVYSKFEARIDYSLQTYSLTAIDSQLLPGTGINWPAVTYIDNDGKEFPLTASSPVDNKVTYSSADKPFKTTASWPTFRLSFNSLNVSEIQNARATISVERNQSLISNSSVKTNSAFLFKTSEVKTSGLAIPLLIFSTRLQMTGNTLDVAIDNTLATLFPVANRLPGLTLTFGIFYAYELKNNTNDPSTSLVSKLPVSLYPDKDFTSTLGADIKNIITGWEKVNQPSKEKGEWVFSMILHSETDGVKRSLLSLEQIYFKELRIMKEGRRKHGCYKGSG